MAKKLAENLTNLRKEKGLKQTDMALLLKINNRQYQRYESGDSDPKLDTLIALADYFDVSLDYLVGRTDKK
ncbi:helix-turn-helix domain-containing protein [Enterococcus faecium]|uniref:helix-turn-helix domain-containing protein n=1 Tax=Enterococcus faecium TaxID=1352 RepID=UPI000CF2A7F0|nr:helix-turn-helix transcriptional regulator [Enterococcus faecium]EGP4751900.1 helix-turn-helix transcriptional regulator [Enterococcus faecium]EGP4986309.1 helix-turn-helix transcriptional regulator [Enterococcus faecium]EGP5088026.1 XRE family transcriptional regulator [Enterococcus faecium]EGP5129995.1 XRE family transcriptional regulator [Enterococcus faecium]EGP5140127.1 XRE family transcriptional regulator [Enterococcus faecium]